MEADDRVREILHRREILQRELLRTEIELNEERTRTAMSGSRRGGRLPSRAGAESRRGPSARSRPASRLARPASPTLSDGGVSQTLPGGAGLPPGSMALRAAGAIPEEAQEDVEREEGADGTEDDAAEAGAGAPPSRRSVAASRRSGRSTTHLASAGSRPATQRSVAGPKLGDDPRPGDLFAMSLRRARSGALLGPEDRAHEDSRAGTGLPLLPVVALERRWQRAREATRRDELEARERRRKAEGHEQLEPIRPLPSHLARPALDAARESLCAAIVKHVPPLRAPHATALRIFRTHMHAEPFNAHAGASAAERASARALADSGHITAQQFERVVRHGMGLAHLHERELRQLFAAADTDGKGSVPLDRLIALLFPSEVGFTLKVPALDRQAASGRKATGTSSSQPAPLLQPGASSTPGDLWDLLRERVALKIKGANGQLSLMHWFDQRLSITHADLAGWAQQRLGIAVSDEQASAMLALIGYADRAAPLAAISRHLLPSVWSAAHQAAEAGDGRGSPHFADDYFARRALQLEQAERTREQRRRAFEHATAVELGVTRADSGRRTASPRPGDRDAPALAGTAGAGSTSQGGEDGVDADDDEHRAREIANALAALTGVGGARAVSQFRTEDEGADLRTFHFNRPAHQLGGSVGAGAAAPSDGAAGSAAMAAATREVDGLGHVSTSDARLWSLPYLKQVIAQKLASRVGNGDRDRHASVYRIFGMPKDGVTLASFRETLKYNLGLALPEADARALFNSIDANGNGVVEFWEFIAAFMPADYPDPHSWSAMHSKWRAALVKGRADQAKGYERKLWQMLQCVTKPSGDAAEPRLQRRNQVSWDFPLARPSPSLDPSASSTSAAWLLGTRRSPLMEQSGSQALGFGTKSELLRNPHMGWPGASLYFPTVVKRAEHLDPQPRSSRSPDAAADRVAPGFSVSRRGRA